MAKSAADRATARFKQLCCLGIGGEAVMPALVRELHDVVACYGVTFFFADEKMRLSNSYTDFSDPYFDRLYLENFHGRPERETTGTFPHAIRVEFGVRDTDGIAAFAGIDAKAFYKSEHWNEVHRPQGLYEKLRLYVHAGGRGRGLGSLTLHRSKGAPRWTAEDRRRLLDLEPFFAHALQRHAVEDLTLADSEESGLIVLDRTGRVQHFSPEGQRLLFLATFPRVAPGTDFGRLDRLPAPLVETCRNLTRIAAGDKRALPPILYHQNVWGGFVFRAFWLTGSSAGAGPVGIVVTRREPVVVRLTRRIGELPLSRRQAEVCLQLAQGRDYEAIAKDLGISKHTAIAHGRWIYNKLDVRNRTELVHRLLS